MARPPSLERRVLDTLWEGGDWSVREVMEAVDSDLAYTTYATVLHRLHGKGRVVRSKEDGVWRYRAARTREAALAREVGKMMRQADGPTEPVLVAFLDQMEAMDPASIERLAALIAARRESS